MAASMGGARERARAATTSECVRAGVGGLLKAFGAALSVGLVAALVFLPGCASRTPLRQPFVELRTENFVLTSSLSRDETLVFARSLEFFHAGVRSLLGLEGASARPAPTQVLLFDDRSFGRPFAVEHEAAYLVDAVEAPILVFRGARDFAARATPELRQRYARRLLRDASDGERALWYEEGVSRLASTIGETAKGVHVGRILESDRRSVLDRRGKTLQGVLSRFDLSDASIPERARFTAQAWAIAHLLEFGPGARTGPDADTLLEAHRRALASALGTMPGQAIAGVDLSPEALAQRVYDHLETGRPRVRQLEARGFDSSRLETVELSPAEGAIRLGRLALGIDRPDLAREAFERALAKQGESAVATFGLAEAEARGGDVERAESLLAAAGSAIEAGRETTLAAADAYRALAVAAPDAGARAGALEKARSLYQSLATGDSPSASARIGLALTHLDVPGENPSGALPWLEAARKLRAGSLELELLRARVEARTGETRSAAIRARNVVTRAPDALLVGAARVLLESLGD